MKEPRLYVVCPVCFRGDLPRTKNGKGLMEREVPIAPGFTRVSRGLGRAKGFEHTHESVELGELPKDVLRVLAKRCRAFLKAIGEDE